jgi:hypothetical protein
MRISRVALAATVLAGSTALGFVVSAGTATAAEVDLPVSAFGDLVVDPVHERLFISDWGAGKIVATDYQGTKIAELDGLPGVNGLSLSADSKVLYAAVRDAHAIVAVNTESVTESDRYPVGEERFPGDVAPVGDKLWFSFDDWPHSGGSGNFASLDPVTDEVVPHDTTDTVWFSDPPSIFVNPANPALLAVADTSSSGSDAAVFDVSSGVPELKLDTNLGVDTIFDVALTADGSTLYGVGYRAARSVTVPAGAKAGPFTGLDLLTSMVLGSDGRIAVGVTGSPTADVVVYGDDVSTPQKTLALGTESDVARGGLAWEPGGSRIFAVLGYSDSYRLAVLNPDAAPSSSASSQPDQPRESSVYLWAPSSATRAQPLELRGAINLAAPPPVGTELILTRADVETPAGRALGTVKTLDEGFWKYIDTPPAGGPVTYTIKYAGSAEYAPASTSAVVEVSRTAPALAIDKNKTINAYGSTVTFTATLGRTYKNRVVEIWADPAGGDQPNRLLRRATMNSAGKVSAAFKLTRNTAVIARFTGDAQYAPRAVTSIAYTRVSVSTKMFKYYKTTKIGSTGYFVYRVKRAPEFTHTMTHYPNRIEHTVIQRYSGGKWRNYASGYFKLVNGKSELIYEGTFKAGQRYRVRSEYIAGALGRDSVNYTTYGAWKYWTFTK